MNVNNSYSNIKMKKIYYEYENHYEINEYAGMESLHINF